jgi:hypothetical protein
MFNFNALDSNVKLIDSNTHTQAYALVIWVKNCFLILEQSVNESTWTWERIRKSGMDKFTIMTDFIITEHIKNHLACLKQNVLGRIYDAYFSPDISMYIVRLLRSILSRIYGRNHFLTPKISRIPGSAWQIIMGSGFDDCVYWHFFLQLQSITTAHISNFWTTSVLRMPHEESVTKFGLISALSNSRIHCLL